MTERLKGVASWGQISINTDEYGKEVLEGIVRTYEGVGASQVMEDLKNEARPYFDYFVFSSPPDPSHPELSRVYVFSTEACNFNRSSKLKQTKLFVKDATGTIGELNAKFLAVEDKPWYPIKRVTAKAVHRENAATSEPEKRIERAFTQRLEAKLKDTEAGIGSIRLAVEKVARELNELIMRRLGQPNGEIEDRIPWGIIDLAVDVIDDPDKKGERALAVSVKFASAPTSIDLNGLPEAVREKAVKWLDTEMRKTFSGHPLIYPRQFSEVGPGLMDDSRTADGKKPIELELRVEGNNVSWRYPQNVPQFKSPVGDRVRSWVARKAKDRVPETLPGAPMPIPAQTFDRLIDNLRKWLEETPGLYNVDISRTDDGTLHLETSQFKHPKIVITDDTVRILKEAGIDLGEEKRVADGDTSNFSFSRHRLFVESIVAKFKKAGWEFQDNLTYSDLNDEAKRKLHVNERGIGELALFWQKMRDGNLVFDPFTFQTFRPLIRPEKFRITGDLDLPGIGGHKAIKKILGGKPLTTEEFRERLLAIEELYHKAGYLITRENPVESGGIQISAILNEDRVSGKIDIKIARIGKLSIEGGGIPEQNVRAIVGAMELKEGEPLKRDILQRIQVAAQRANFELSDTRIVPDFILRPDGKTDVVIYAHSRQNMLQGSISANGESAMVSGTVLLHHRVRGLSEIGASISGGFFAADANPGTSWHDRLIGSASVSMQSVPLNDDGIYVSSVVGLGRTPYIYRDSEGSIAESGTTYGGNASLTVHIPIGGAGISSPFYLSAGVRGRAAHRDGRHFDAEGDREVNKTIYSIGEEAGIEYFNVSQLTRRDKLRILAQFGMDQNLTDRQGDATVQGSLVYVLPLGKDFELEEKAAAGIRIPVYGDFSFDRSFMPGNVPLVDFGRRIADPYAATFFWYEGVFLMFTKSQHVQVGLGGTVSSGSNGNLAAGGGMVIRIPLLGMSLYIGSDMYGKPTFGLGIGRVWEL